MREKRKIGIISQAKQAKISKISHVDVSLFRERRRVSALLCWSQEEILKVNARIIIILRCLEGLEGQAEATEFTEQQVVTNISLTNVINSPGRRHT